MGSDKLDSALKSDLDKESLMDEDDDDIESFSEQQRNRCKGNRSVVDGLFNEELAEQRVEFCK